MQARRRRAASATVIVLVAFGASAALGDVAASAADDPSAGAQVVPPAGEPPVVDDPAPDPSEAAEPAPSSRTTPGSTTVPGSTSVPGSTATPGSTTAPGSTAPQPRLRGAKVAGIGVGVARRQHAASKWHEAAVSCRRRPLETSGLLGIKSGTSERDHGWLTLTIVAITAAAGAFLLVAFLVRRRADAGKSRATTFELVGGVVAIIGTLAGLVTAFIPGVGVRERPVPQVTMTVREVHARIIRSVYQQQTGRPFVRDTWLTRRRLVSAATDDDVVHETSDGLRVARDHAAALNGLEIGNVAWLELHFSGYRNKTLTLQWALFRPGGGGALIVGTDLTQPIEVDDSGEESVKFVPIWFGAPRLPQFRAEFRILNDRKVLQMASTKAMRGLAYRYACPERQT